MSSLESPTFPPVTLLENEEWRPVVGYEGVYSVSNYSRVYVHPRKANGRNGGVRLLKGRILRPTTDKKNHWYVGLTKDSKVKYKYIHRLSLEAFVGPPPAEASECCHSDDDPNNNHISNLRWGTRSDNANDMMNNGNGRSHAPRSANKPNDSLPAFRDVGDEIDDPRTTRSMYIVTASWNRRATVV